MQQEHPKANEFNSEDRRKRTWRIVIAHVLIVATFFVASFLWGKFT